MALYFPMFVSLDKKKVLVVGGGNIAARRIKVLLDFGCEIHVIAPILSSLLKEYEGLNLIQAEYRAYQTGDCKGYYLVLGATNQREVNHRIALECKENNIIVNISDCKEECDFYFPAVIHKEGTVIGVTASGVNHRRAKQVAARIREAEEGLLKE